MMSLPKYGLRKGNDGPWLTAPHRILTQGAFTTDTTHARKWKKENGAYVYRKRHGLREFVVRPIMSEHASV